MTTLQECLIFSLVGVVIWKLAMPDITINGGLWIFNCGLIGCYVGRRWS